MAPETLGVDPVSLSGFGNEMLAAAADIPLAPPPFTSAGADPITMKIMESVPFIEAPIQTGLPEIKAEATKTASNIVDAAARYLQTDEQLAKAYESQQFDNQGGSPGGGARPGLRERGSREQVRRVWAWRLAPRSRRPVSLVASTNWVSS